MKKLLLKLRRLKYVVLTYKDYYKKINRSVTVENTLWEVVARKRGLLSKEECEELARKLGTPTHLL